MVVYIYIYRIHCFPTPGLHVFHIFYTTIYSLYYTMGYVINLLSPYNYIRYIGHIIYIELHYFPTSGLHVFHISYT